VYLVADGGVLQLSLALARVKIGSPTLSLAGPHHQARARRCIPPVHPTRPNRVSGQPSRRRNCRTLAFVAPPEGSTATTQHGGCA